VKFDADATIQVIVNWIRTAVELRLITREAGDAAIMCLHLEGDEAVLANRLITRGADPFALEYVNEGKVSDKVRAAHYAGPGVYSRDDPERRHYLTLCALSADETKDGQDQTLRDRVLEFAQGLADLNALEVQVAAPRDDLERHADAEEKRIMETPTIQIDVGCVNMMVGTSDRVFAKAYWSGRPCAGVYHVHPVEGPGILVGCDPQGTAEVTLFDLGVKVDKTIKPDLGVVTDELTLTRVAGHLERAGFEVPRG